LHEWQRWKFAQVPQGYWKDKSNHRKFLDWMGTQLEVKRMEDWYAIPHFQIVQYAGRLLEYYNLSHISAITTVYNEHKWEPWKFSHVAQRFWGNTANHKAFLGWLGQKLNVKHMSDWYKIKSGDFSQHKGSMLLRFYQESPGMVVMNILTEHKWEPWRFLYSRTRACNSKYLQSFVESLEKNLQIHSYKQWYNVSTGVITAISRLPFSKFYSGLGNNPFANNH